jgi:hypothetical protein
VSLRGWERPEVGVVADPAQIDVQQREGQETLVRLRIDDDAVLQVPLGSSLRLEHIKGDLALSGVGGRVHLGIIEGDASLRDTGPLVIEKVQGDLSARNVQGDCTVGRVENDASIGRVAGALIVDDAANDLAIDSVRGSLRAVAGNDLSLRTYLRAGCTYEVRAGNDITCRIPTGANARVSLSAGDRIKAHRLGIPIPAGNRIEFQMGTGDATLSLVAGDDIDLVGDVSGDAFDFDFGPDMGARLEDLAQRVAAQIEMQVGSVARQLDEKLAGMGGSEEVATRIQERILAAARRAEEKITEAMRNAEARSREAEQRQRGRAGWPPPPPPPPARPPKAPTPPVSEEERLMVLRMVSEGKISVEQAEKLLAALTGGTGDR